MYLFWAPLVSNTCEAPAQNELCTAMLAKTGHILTPSDPALYHDSILVVTWTLLTPPPTKPESSICIAQPAVSNFVSCSGLPGRLPSACPLKSWPHKAQIFFLPRGGLLLFKVDSGKRIHVHLQVSANLKSTKLHIPTSTCAQYACMRTYTASNLPICLVPCSFFLSSIMASHSLELVICVCNALQGA